MMIDDNDDGNIIMTPLNDDSNNDLSLHMKSYLWVS